MTRTLLLVEDDANFREDLREHLDKAGYTVNVTSTYKAGLNAAIDKPYDIVVTDTILLDNNFPDMTFYGTELCRQLRRRGHEGVIIGMSGSARMSIMGAKEENLADVYQKNGADAFIKKSNIETLESTIETALVARMKS